MRGDVTPAWTLIIVPPKLTSSPKRVGVKMRWLRMLAMLMAAGLSASWFWVTTQARIAETVADQLAEEQRATLALRDTLLSFRAASAIEAARRAPPPDMLMPGSGEVTRRFSRAAETYRRILERLGSSEPRLW